MLILNQNDKHFITHKEEKRLKKEEKKEKMKFDFYEELRKDYLLMLDKLGGVYIIYSHLDNPLELRKFLKIDNHIPICYLDEFEEPHSHLNHYYYRKIKIKEFMVMDKDDIVIDVYKSYNFDPPKKLLQHLENEYNKKLNRPPHQYNYLYGRNYD